MTDLTHPLTGKYKGYLTDLFTRGMRGYYDVSGNTYANEIKDAMVIWQRGLNPQTQHDGHNDGVSCLADVLKLPEYEPDNTISAIIKTVRENEGGASTYFVRVWIQPGSDSTGQCELQSRVEPIIYVPQTALRIEDVPVIQDKDADIGSAYHCLRALISDRLYFTHEVEYDLIALGACSSYFREVFSAYPYYDINSATYGSGKTRTLECLIYASYHGALFIIPTEAAIFRVVEDTKGALGIDEIDNLYVNPKQNANLINLLDAGYRRGAEVVRIDMESGGVAKSYDGFGLKGFTRKGPLPNSLISRTISITMTENKGFKQLKHDVTPDTFSAVRADLMSYRLRHTGTVRATYEALQNTDLGINGRTRELYLPLLTVAKIIDAGLFTRVLEHAKGEGERKDQLKHDPIVVYLVELLVENLSSYTSETEYRVTKIRDDLNAKLRELGELGEKKGYGSKTVISMLELLGFERGKTRSQGYISYCISATRVNILKQVYLPPIPTSPTSPTSPTPPSAAPKNEAEPLIPPTTATPSATPRDLGEESEVSEVAKDEWGELQKTVVDGVEYPLIKYSNGGLCRLLLLECSAGHRAVYKVALGSKPELIACAKGQHATGLTVVRDLSAEISGGAQT
jgi:hypothetical protein